jgi:hypothetical protein
MEDGKTGATDTKPDSAELSRIVLIYGFAASQAVAVAAKLGLANLLKEGPKSIGELANATKTHPPSLGRLLRMLTSVGVFAEDLVSTDFLELT